MKKHLQFLLLFAVLLVPWVTHGQTNTLTVASGTAQNQYIPVYSYYMDNNMMTQCIYSDEMLSDLRGMSITELKFYSNFDNTFSGITEVYLGITSNDNLSSGWATDYIQNVWYGNIVIANNEMVITLETPFDYPSTGGNLLVQFFNFSYGNCGTMADKFYGVNATGASCYVTSYPGTPSVQGFLPKCTFTYSLPSSCPKPKNVITSNITANGATVSWTKGEDTQNNFVVAYGTGTDADQMATVSATTNTATLTGLTPTTTYNVYVKAVCSANDQSVWSNVCSFTTTAVPTTVDSQHPYSQDFEGDNDFMLINGFQTNAWAVGSATNHGGTKSLYISQDHGTHNTYNRDFTSLVFATKLFDLGAGTFHYSYDWKADGESNYDYLRVALVPSSESFTAGSTPTNFSTTDLPSNWIALDGGSKLNRSSSWNTKSDDVNVVSAGQYNLVFVWKNDGSGGSQPPAAIDNVSFTQPSCPTPSSVEATDITANGATISWTKGSAEQNNFVVAYGTGTDPAAMTTVNATTNTATLTGLTPTTTYNVYVKAVCSANDQSVWCDVRSFTTTAVPTVVDVQHPYSQGFESDNDFMLINGSLTNAWAVGSATNNGGTKSLYISQDHGTNNTYNPNNSSVVFATKLFDLGAGTFHYSYDWKANGESCCDYLRVALVPVSVTFTAGTDNPSGFGGTTLPTDWIALDGGSKRNQSSSWQTYSGDVNVASAGQYNLVFVWRNDGSGGYDPPAAIDNVSFTQPSCPTPSSVEATDITANGATISWTKGSAEQNNFVVAYGTGTDADQMPTVNATTNTATLTGLTANTAYKVFVKAVCSATEESSWSNMGSFLTPCNATSTFPITENFDAPEFVPSCWSQGSIALTNSWSRNTSRIHGSTGGSANIPDKFAGTQTALTSMPIAFDAASKYQVTFWMYRPSNSYQTKVDEAMHVYVASQPNSTTGAVELGVINNHYLNAPAEAADGWYEYTFDLPAGTSGDKFIMFVYHNQYGAGAYIDDITIDIAPTCLKPSAVEASDITADGATISWTKGEDTQNNFVVAYGTGNDADQMPTVNATTNTVALTGLTPITTYNVYVKAVCSATEESEWSNMGSFRTAFDCQTAFGNNFESREPICGTGTTTSYSLPFYSSTSYTQTKSWMLYKASEWANEDVYSGKLHSIALQNTNAADVTFPIKVYVAHTDKTTLTDSDSTALSIANMTLVYDGNYTFVGGSDWSVIDFTTPFDFNPNSNLIFVMMRTASMSPNTSSVNFKYTYTTGTGIFRYTSGSYWYGGFSSSRPNMKLGICSNIPSCFPVTNVTADDVTATSATITWAKGTVDQNNFVVAYGTGTDPDQMSTVNATTNTATLTGLTANTVYNFFVKAVCSADDQSEWSVVKNFRTACEAVTTFPITENFDATEFVPSCWSQGSIALTNTWSRNTSTKHGSTGGSANIPDKSAGTQTALTSMPIVFDAASKYQVTFWMYRPSNSYQSKVDEAMHVYVASQPNSTTGAVELGVINNHYLNAPAEAAAGWYEYTFELPDGTSGDKYIMFVYHNQYGAGAYIDDITIEIAPTCIKPSDVVASNVTPNSATLTWTPTSTRAQESSYEVVYGVDGQVDKSTATPETPTTNTLALSNLAANTQYVVYVRSYCNDQTYSEWSEAYKFTTPCAPKTLTKTVSYTENFNSYTYGIATSSSVPTGYSDGTNDMPDCWRFLNVSKSSSSYPQAFLSSYSSYAVSGNCLFFRSSSITPAYAILPSFTNDIRELQLKFTYRNEGVSANNGTLSLGYMTDPQDATTFVPLQSMAQTTTLTTIEHDFALDNNTALLQSQGNYYIAFKYTGGSYDNYYLAIDDVEVTVDTTCFAPHNLASSNVYAQEATISWENSPRSASSAWQIVCAKASASLASGEKVNATENPWTLHNLEPETEYQLAVRSICGTGDTSILSDTIHFTTTATCVVPGEVTVAPATITTNSAKITWAERTLPVSATQWEVVVGENGFNPQYADNRYIVNGTAECVAQGLKHSTSYEVRVRARCSEDDWSNWTEPVSFTTLCDVWNYEDMPIVENFDNVAGTTSTTVHMLDAANCWNYLNSGTFNPGYPTAINLQSSARSGNNFMVFQTTNDATGADQYAIFPQVNFDVDTIDLEFYARKVNDAMSATITVGVMSDPADASTFHPVQTINPTSTDYALYTVKFSGYAEGGQYVAIKAAKPTADYNAFYIDDVTMKLREKINYLPGDAAYNSCREFFLVDTVNGTYANNLNFVTTIYPEPGKVLQMTGSINTQENHDIVTIYEGVGTTGQVLYTGSGLVRNIDTLKTTSYDWASKGAMTIKFTSDASNDRAYTGFKLFVECVCPEQAPAIDETVDTINTYVWAKNNRSFSYVVNQPNKEDKLFEDTYMTKNVANCDSLLNRLHLTIHPTYILSQNVEFCTYDENGQQKVQEWFNKTYSTTGVYTDTLKTVYNADSIGTLSLQVRPAPVAAIYANNKKATTLDAYCQGANLNLSGRSDKVGSTFVWEDNSTEVSRVVNPDTTTIYTIKAIDPTYGCYSLPVSLTVNTTPVPALSIVATDTAICIGESTTLTVVDANNIGATYRWNTGATGTSITVSPNATATYTVTATTTNGSNCTATAQQKVTVNALPEVTITTSATEICRYKTVTLGATQVEGYNYTWTGNRTGATITVAPEVSGAYHLQVVDANGCQKEFNSPVITVNNAYQMNDTMSVCAAMLPITWGEQTLEESGDYTQTWTIAHGCDSTVSLNFQVTATGTSNSYRELCEGAAFSFGEGQYKREYTATESTVISYIDSTSETCPVQHNLNLTVNPKKTASFNASECVTYTWNDSVYTVSGSYQQTLATTKGCDSTVTMNLVIRETTTGIDVRNVCDQLEWLDGQIYTADNNTATVTLTNAAGCDSVVTLNLTLRHATVGVDSILWCDSRSYTWKDGNTYNMSETDGSVTYLEAVKNAQNCDSITALNLVFNLPLDTLFTKDTTVCDIFFKDVVDCQGNISEYQTTQNGLTDLLRLPMGTGYVMARYNVKIDSSEYATKVVRNECLPYEWKLANGMTVAVIDRIYSGNDTTVSYSPNTSGCGHTDVLRLISMKQKSFVTETGEVCQYENYTTGSGAIITATDVEGESTFQIATTTKNVDGCDYDSTLVLTVHPVSNDTAEVVLCESDFVNGRYTYHAENGTHFDTVLTIPALNGQPYSNTIEHVVWNSVYGCDSVLTINYTVNPTTYQYDVVESPYKYVWDANDRAFEGNGTYADTVVYKNQNAYKCDSIEILDLTIYDTVITDIDTVVCTEYIGPDGIKYRDNKTFRKAFVDAAQRGGVVLDSVVYTHFIVAQRQLTEQFVVSTDPYTWFDGNTYTADTNEVYYNLTSADGCDSTLALTFTRITKPEICVEALPYAVPGSHYVIPAGVETGNYTHIDANGNDTIISYVINHGTFDIDVQTACDTYTWSKDHNAYTVSGDYTYNYNNAKGCASVDTLRLTVNYNSDSIYTVTACDTFAWFGTTYKASGKYARTYTTAENCPSVDSLYLTINNNTNSALTDTGCVTYTWNGSTYDATGDYTYNYFTTEGCPSTDTLHLTIGAPVRNVESATECDEYVWHGQTYTVSGTYHYDYTDVYGCTSTDTLNLTIKKSTSSDTTVDVCDAFTWNATKYEASGDYTFDTLNAVGCDSVANLHLTIRHNSNQGFTVSNCVTYTWNDSTITTSGTYFHSYTSSENCPSVDTLHLTILEPTSYDSTLVCSDGSYTYKDTLLIGGITPKTYGPFVEHYTNAAGCDSSLNITIVVGLTNISPVTKIACRQYTWTAADHGNGVTYQVLTPAEAEANPTALYKTSTGTMIYENPTYVEHSATTVDHQYLLNLILNTGFDTVDSRTVLMSTLVANDSNMVIGDSIFDFSAEIAAKQNATVVRDVIYPAVHTCDSMVTYTLNLIYNYATEEDTICATQTTYTWNAETITTTTPGTVYTMTQNLGTGDDMVVTTKKIYQYPVLASVDTVEACDSVQWHNNWYYADNTTATFTDHKYALDCDSVITLNLTVKHATHNVETQVVCESYTWHGATYDSSDVYTYAYTNTDGCASLDTLHLTINHSTSTGDSVTACDAYTWKGHEYPTSGTYYTDTYPNEFNCMNVDTLYLTINKNSGHKWNDTVVCDSMSWYDSLITTNGTYMYTYLDQHQCSSIDTIKVTVNNATHTVVTANECGNYYWDATKVDYKFDATTVYPDTILREYTNMNNCPSVDTLFLTLRTATGDTSTVVNCGSYLWRGEVRATSGTYTYNTTNVAGCDSNDVLYLTVNVQNEKNDTIITSKGYIRYPDNNTGVYYTFDRAGGDYFDTMFVENLPATVEGACDTVHNIHLRVGTATYLVDPVNGCNEYTWINGHTYKWIKTDTLPGVKYYDATENRNVTSNPQYTMTDTATALGFEVVKVLNLSLSPIVTHNVTVDFRHSMGTYVADTARNVTFDLSHMTIGSSVDTVHHFGEAAYYCDSVVYYHINIIDNYDTVTSDDICCTNDQYIWDNTTLGGSMQTIDLTQLITDFDHASMLTFTDTVNAGDPQNEIVYRKIVNVHPMVYVTERRTACDSYTWYGTEYTESTTSATKYFAPMENGNFCDSTITLNLTIKYNTNADYTVTECNSYKWHDDTLTVSGVYTYEYLAANDCPSVDSLFLTINYKSDSIYTATVCDTYTWASDGQEYTTTGKYANSYTTAEGCPSIDSLYLTVNKSTTSTTTLASCDSLTWNGVKYTTSGDYTYTTDNAKGCDSVATLHLTINPSYHNEETLAKCDFYVWFGDTLTVTGDYTNNGTTRVGCDSISTLHLTINKSVYTSVTDTACDTYTWHGNTYTTTGVYTDPSTTAAGCEQVDTLHLTVFHGTHYGIDSVYNHCGPFTWIVNGETIATYTENTETSTDFVSPITKCDSVVYLKLTVIDKYDFSDADTVCAETLPYTWTVGNDSRTLTETGDYTIEYTAINGCDSIYRFALTVNPTLTTNLTDQVCLGNGYEGYDFVITAAELPTAGEYTFTKQLQSAITGCDSNITLTITVGEVLINVDSAVACDSYLWNAGDGNSYTYAETGVYATAPYANAMGCTSIDSLYLTINKNSSTPYTETACDTYTWNGMDYTTTGIYTFDYVDANGCASTDTLHLTVNYNSNHGVTETACDTYTWNGTEYTTTGDYTYNYTTEQGCPSVDTLHLTVNYNSNQGYTDTACDTYTWHGTEYTTTGDYTYNYTTAQGCASVDTLHLTVNHNSSKGITEIACDSYTWTSGNGQTYTDGGIYLYDYNTAEGCASTDTLTLTVNYNSNMVYAETACDTYTWNGTEYTVSGDYTFDYTTPEGCPSTDTLHLTVNYNSNKGETETACESFTWHGTEYTTSGDYTYNYMSATGCASTDTLHLTVNYNSNQGYTETVCDTYTWNGTEYTTSGDFTYNYINALGCASVDTLHLTVNHNSSTAYTETACDNYTWVRTGETYTTSGDYTYNYTTAQGCASTDTLHLTLNFNTNSAENADECDIYIWHGTRYTASGDYTYDYTTEQGCASTDTLHLTIRQSVSNSFDATACFGSVYVWNDMAYYYDGTYQQVFTAANGCDSVVTMNLTFGDQIVNNISVTNCGPYTWNEATYTTSGVYSQTFTSTTDCDSTVNLTLTVNNPTSSNMAETACESYTWNGNVYTNSGVYTYTTTGANGCDSVATLVLTINHGVNTAVSQTACETYTWNGSTYTTSGNYTYTHSDAQGCSTTDTLHLTINYGIHDATTETACNSFFWNGQNYTASGDYTYSYTSAQGCASVDTLHLTVNYSAGTKTTETACDSYTWNGNVYTTSGFYTYSYNTPAGCPSVDTLILTVNYSNHSAMTATACDSYNWNGTTYTTSGDYVHEYTTAQGCASADTLHLTVHYNTNSALTETACDIYTWNGQNYTNSGDYTFNYLTVDGCASVDTLHLTINYNTSTAISQTVCDEYTWHGTTYTVTGDYTYDYTTADGCYSVDTLRLVVKHNSNSARIDVACDQYTWNGEMYTTSGTYTYAYMSTEGCASVDTLYLTVSYNTSAEFTETACDVYQWHDAALTESGVYTYDYTTAEGCPSTDVLNLTVNYSTHNAYTEQATNSYTWHGVEYTTSDTYTYSYVNEVGCASADTLHLTILSFEAPQIDHINGAALLVNHYPNGSTNYVDYIDYRWVRDGQVVAEGADNFMEASGLLNGCYHVEVPVDATRTTWAVSNEMCFRNGVVSIDDVDAIEVSFTVTPNPVAKGAVMTVTTELPEYMLQGATLTMFDLNGRILLSQPMTQQSATIVADQASGVYMIQITTQSGEKHVKKVVIR